MQARRPEHLADAELLAARAGNCNGQVRIVDARNRQDQRIERKDHRCHGNGVVTEQRIVVGEDDVRERHGTEYGSDRNVGTVGAARREGRKLADQFLRRERPVRGKQHVRQERIVPPLLIVRSERYSYAARGRHLQQQAHRYEHVEHESGRARFGVTHVRRLRHLADHSGDGDLDLVLKNDGSPEHLILPEEGVGQALGDDRAMRRVHRRCGLANLERQVEDLEELGVDRHRVHLCLAVICGGALWTQRDRAGDGLESGEIDPQISRRGRSRTGISRYELRIAAGPPQLLRQQIRPRGFGKVHVAADERIDIQIGRDEAHDREDKTQQVDARCDSEAPERPQRLGEIVLKHDLPARGSRPRGGLPPPAERLSTPCRPAYRRCGLHAPRAHASESPSE